MYVLAGLLLLLTAWTWWVYHDVVQQLNALRTHTVARYYRVDFKKISPDFLKGRIRIEDFRIFPTDSALQLLDAGRLPYLVRGSFATLQLSDIAWGRIVYREQLGMGAAIVDHPALTYLFNGSKPDTAILAGALPLSLDRENRLPLYISRARLRNVALRIEDITHRQPLLQLDSTTIALTGLSVSDWDADQPLRYHTCDIRLQNLETTLLPGHRLKAGRIDISLQDSSLKIMHPVLTTLPGPATVPVQLHITMDALLVNGLDIPVLLASQTVKAASVRLFRPEVHFRLLDTVTAAPTTAGRKLMPELSLDLRRVQLSHARLLMVPPGMPVTGADPEKALLEGNRVNILLRGFHKTPGKGISCRDVTLDAEKLTLHWLRHRIELRRLRYGMQKQELSAGSLTAAPLAAASAGDLRLRLNTGRWTATGCSIEQLLLEHRLSLTQITADSGQLEVDLPAAREGRAGTKNRHPTFPALAGSLCLHHWSLLIRDRGGRPAGVYTDLNLCTDTLDFPVLAREPLAVLPRLRHLDAAAARIPLPGEGNALALEGLQWQQPGRITAQHFSVRLTRDDARISLLGDDVDGRHVELPLLFRSPGKTIRMDSLLIGKITLAALQGNAAERQDPLKRLQQLLQGFPLAVAVRHIQVASWGLNLEQPGQQSRPIRADSAQVHIRGLTYTPAEGQWHYAGFLVLLPGITLDPLPGYTLRTDTVLLDLKKGNIVVRAPGLFASERQQPWRVSVNVQADRVRLDEVDMQLLLERQLLRAGRLQVDHPVLDLRLRPGLRNPGKWLPDSMQYPFFFQHINIENADIRVARANDSQPLFTIRDARLLMDEFRTLPPADTSLMDFQRLQLFSNAFNAQTEDGHRLTIGDFQLDSRGQTVHTGAVQFTPPTDPVTFSRSLKTGEDWVKAGAEGVDIRQFNIRAFLSSGVLHAGYVAVRQPVIQAYRDKRVPPPTAYRPLPVSRLLSARLPVYIDTLGFSGGRITYEEKALPLAGREVSKTPPRPYTTSIYFNGVEGWAAPLTTLPARPGVPRYLDIDAHARLMNSGSLEAFIRFNLERDANDFMVQGRLQHFPVGDLNSLLEQAARVRFAGGQVDSIAFFFQGNDRLASGRLRGYYQGLRLDLVDADQERRSWVLNKLVNIFIRRNNSAGEKKPYIATIHVKRDPTKGIFNYWWKALRSGLVDAVLPFREGRKKEILRERLQGRRK
ncbi:hypothetical protein GCM10023143_23240 [Compostibacter hankyongensis]|uniref:DUF748 domain-containing protein n=1 Tax=Compostibacter hankyongensis TaxID=1007089 RepID=A0ABP8FXQ3_9BACT